jgi:hypothetical protein
LAIVFGPTMDMVPRVRNGLPLRLVCVVLVCSVDLGRRRG